MYFLRLQGLFLIGISGGVAIILITTLLISRIKYKTNGPFICFNFCCKKSSKINPVPKDKNKLEQIEIEKGEK
jgi:hypothetical protein